MSTDCNNPAPAAVSPIHYTLGIAEIVQHIVENCARSTLISLSRVDKALSDVALNELWRSQDSLDNSMRCLPSRIRPKNSGLNTCHHDVVTVLSDWHRFDFYARRIQSLVVGSIQDRSSIAFLIEHYRGPFPFVQLGSLRMQGYVACMNRFDFLFGSTLKYLSLEPFLAHKEESFFANLSYLPRTSPGLRSLTFITSQPIITDLAQLIEQLPNLHSLSLRSHVGSDFCMLSEQFITVLAGMQRLNSFDTSYSIYNLFSDTSQLQRPAIPFPSLRALQLRITTDDPECCRQVLSSLSSVVKLYDLTSLTTLMMSSALHNTGVVDEATLSAVEGLTRTMGMVISHTTLTTFHLVCCVAAFDPLRPILAFKNLQDVEVYLAKVNDNVCAEMAAAWPHLTHLHIHSFDNKPALSAMPTFTSLTLFARRCPGLTSLALPIDATVVPPLSSETRSCGNACLEELCVNDSPLPLENKCAIAVFLIDIFPRLGTVWGYSIRADDHTDYWEDVADMLPVLSLARKHWQAPHPPSTTTVPR